MARLLVCGRAMHVSSMVYTMIRILTFCLIGSFSVAAMHSVAQVKPRKAVGGHSIGLVELWRLGDSEDDDVFFEHIRSVAADSRGQAYVVDYRHPAIYVISRDGTLVRELGSLGRAPGEFEDPFSVYVGASDTVYVFDEDVERVTMFSPGDHGLAGTVQVLPDGIPGFPQRLFGTVPQGFILGYRRLFMQGELSDEHTLDVAFVDRRGVKREELLVQLPIRERIAYKYFGASGFYWMPFGPREEVAVSLNGLVYFGYGNSPAITIRSVDEEVHRNITWTRDPEPVTPRDVDALFSRENLARQERSYRSVMRKTTLPTHKPAFHNFAVDDKDRVWIQMSAPHGAEAKPWLILDGDGKEQAVIELPANVRLEAIRAGRAYGVVEDGDDDYTLIAYAVREID